MSVYRYVSVLLCVSAVGLYYGNKKARRCNMRNARQCVMRTVMSDSVLCVLPDSGGSYCRIVTDQGQTVAVVIASGYCLLYAYDNGDCLLHVCDNVRHLLGTMVTIMNEIVMCQVLGMNVMVLFMSSRLVSGLCLRVLALTYIYIYLHGLAKSQP